MTSHSAGLTLVPCLSTGATVSIGRWRNWNPNSARPLLPDALAPTRERLAHLREGLTQYQQQLTSILKPLKPGQALARETHIAIGTQLPGHHNVTAYMQNVFRDWCWGDAENQQVSDYLMSILQPALQAQQHPAPIKVLVLGAGAGRLAYDLHRHCNAGQTWALDSNPLLCLIGSAMAKGTQLALTEFPLAPVSAQDSAVLQTLQAPQSVEGLRFVCADALNAPFSDAAFDLVVTPWLLDVIDAPLDSCVGAVAHLLKPDGLWLTHGSLAFTGRAAIQYGPDEFAALSEKCGFKIHHSADQWLPYLHSPASRHHRQELTFTQLGQLHRAPNKRKRQPHNALPEWLTHSNRPVPLSDAFQTQIMSTRIHAFIMSLIDGNRSIADMAQVLEQQRLMPANDATQAIRQFLTRMLEEARRSHGPE